MTNNADLYASLLRAGAPKLPENYVYKFWQAKKKMQYFDSSQEDTKSRALYMEIRKKYWGGLFSLNATGRVWYITQRDLNYRYSDDNITLVNRGWLTDDDLDGTYKLAHMAYLAEQCNKQRIDMEKRKKKPDTSTQAISAYLNKRLP